MSVEPARPRNLDQLDLPQPVWSTPRSWRSVTLGLRQIMILVIYCSVVLLAGRAVADTGSPASVAILGVLVGLGLCYLGIWLAIRLIRLALLGWVMFVVGYIIATASLMGWLVVPTVPILLGVLFYLQIQHQHNQQNGLLWVLAVASNRQIPLAPGVEAYAQQSHGISSTRAHALAVLLQGGHPLSSAIGWVPRVVPRETRLLVRIGEQTGRLAPGLREAAENRSKSRSSLQSVIGRIGYLGLVLAVCEGVLGYASFRIVPQFEAIFRDFGLNLPVSTQFLIRLAADYRDSFLWLGVGQVILTLYLMIMLMISGLDGVPGLGWLFQFRHKSLILRSLAMVIEANQPLDRAFEILAKEYPWRRIRRKIQRASAAIRSGADWTAALEFVRVLSPPDVGVLEAASRVGNLPWALRALAETGERRFAYRLQIGSHLAFLVSILLLGLFVLFIAVALFTPLVDLIERLT